MCCHSSQVWKAVTEMKSEDCGLERRERNQLRQLGTEGQVHGYRIRWGEKFVVDAKPNRECRERNQLRQLGTEGQVHGYRIRWGEKFVVDAKPNRECRERNQLRQLGTEGAGPRIQEKVRERSL